MKKERIIFHLDVNSAYLSWSAAYRLQQGHTLDIRTVPCVIGGDELSRHGIVLAKSIPAKKYGIKTGNPLRTALEQCPNLMIVPPDYQLYSVASKAMVAIFKEYAPQVQQFSVDECFIDFTSMENLFGDPIDAANTIRNRVRDELGFTINVGISTNKLLAKMASDFSKPDKVHTLWKHEIADKMWPLPVNDLFMVGRQTTKKLHRLGIKTIGDLAHTPLDTLTNHFKSFGIMIHQFANGVDAATVKASNFEVVKGMGNSTTVRFDVTQKNQAYLVLLSLCESVGMRLPNGAFCTGLVAVSIVTNDFNYMSHQRKLAVATDSTTYIHSITKTLFDELWDHKTPIRKLGVRVTNLQDNTYFQQSLLVDFDFDKQKKIDTFVDELRGRYGKGSIQRASFIHSGLNPVTGGIGEDGYPVMTSIL